MKKSLIGFALLLLTACGTIHNLQYTPRDRVHQVIDSHQSTVYINVTDSRDDEDSIGRYNDIATDGTYLGQKTITSQTNVAELLQDSLELELRHSGYSLTNPTLAQMIVEVELKKFFFDGFKSGNKNLGGEVLYIVKVTPNGESTPLFTKKVKCKGTWVKGWFSIETPIVESLERGLDESIKQLMNDEKFLSALMNKKCQTVEFQEDSFFYGAPTE
ncbi:MAG: YajG family lipoprotein [Rhabdochlamydiaceae bacterium]|nr:YajG family lipoprotein [Candidatus Amphrikana amoebophyrae]